MINRDSPKFYFNMCPNQKMDKIKLGMDNEYPEIRECRGKTLLLILENWAFAT